MTWFGKKKQSKVQPTANKEQQYTRLRSDRQNKRLQKQHQQHTQTRQQQQQMHLQLTQHQRLQYQQQQQQQQHLQQQQLAAERRRASIDVEALGDLQARDYFTSSTAGSPTLQLTAGGYQTTLVGREPGAHRQSDPVASVFGDGRSRAVGGRGEVGEAPPTECTRQATTANQISLCNAYGERVKNLKSDQVLVFVRVVFVKIGEIDTLKETFMADVFIQLKWREPTLDGKRHAASEPIDWSHYWQPRLYVENTVGEPSESVWHQLVFTGDGQAIVYERRRVKGCFLENLELDQFPFDTQELTLTLTSELWEREVVLEEDESELSSINVESFVDEQEWYLHKHTDMSKRLRASQYQDSDCKHPSISASCRASRRAGFYIWNIFLVMMFICSLAFATFSVDCQLPQNRLQLSFLLLLTTITFKFVVSQTLPRISYLTYLDKYILISMAILCSVCVWHSIVPLFGEGLDVKLDKVALFGLGGFYVLFHVVFVLRIYSLYIKKHWKYSEKDRVHGERLYSTHTGGNGTEDSA